MHNYTLHYQREFQKSTGYTEFITVKKNGTYFRTFIFGFGTTMHEAIAAATEAVTADIIGGQMPAVDIQIAEINPSAE